MTAHTEGAMHLTRRQGNLVDEKEGDIIVAPFFCFTLNAPALYSLGCAGHSAKGHSRPAVLKALFHGFQKQSNQRTILAHACAQ